MPKLTGMSDAEKAALVRYHAQRLNEAFHLVPAPTRAELLESAQRIASLLRSMSSINFGRGA